MIVDSSRDGLLDGDCGSSPLNLAFFYGASPNSSESSCSPTHSAPESPGSELEFSGGGGGGGSCHDGRRRSSADFGKRRYSRSGARSGGQGTDTARSPRRPGGEEGCF